MNILVTGGAGFIGSNLALELQKKHDVIVLDNLSHSDKMNLRGFESRFIKDDIRKFDYSKINPEIIFHEAAITDTTIKNRKLMFDVNARAFERILQFAQKTNCKVIYASSAAVYGSGKCPMKETQKPKPLGLYGESKIEMESVVKKYPNVTSIGLRYFNVYGQHEQFKGSSASMIYQLYKQMSQELKPKLFRWGQQIRDYIYVLDVVSANLAAMKLEKSIIINVGTGKPTSFNELVKILNKELKTNLEPEYINNPYNFYQNKTQADTKLAKKLLGWKARYNIKKGLHSYIKFLRSMV